MSSFVLCVRKKDTAKDEFGESFGAASYLEVKDGEPVPRPSHALASVEQWLRRVLDAAAPGAAAAGACKDIVFFVHGYNTTPKEALIRQRLVERELAKRGVNVVVVGFDWPTAGTATAYLYDRFEALKAADVLTRGGIIPFTRFNRPGCPVQVHVMAHSMGGFVVREAFRSMDKGRDADLSNDWRVGQMVLFAADVSSSSFALGNPDMLPVFRHCGRLTNYFSGYDEALGVSNVKNLDISSRVGRVGMPPNQPISDKAIDVDCGPRYHATAGHHLEWKIIDGMESHSWYLEDERWYDDLAYTLAGSIDRNSIPTRRPAAGGASNDFVLKPE